MAYLTKFRTVRPARGPAALSGALLSALALTACFPLMGGPSAGGVPGQTHSREELAAQANARNAAHHPANAVLAQQQPIETVPGSEAPRPAEAGSGWVCFEARQTEYSSSSPQGDSSLRSYCRRSVEDCRAAANQLSNQRAASTREHLEVDVTACREQPKAFCTYRWFDGSPGEDICAARKEDCQMTLLSMTAPGGATKQSECRPVK